MYPRSGFRSGGTCERTLVPGFRSGGTSERTLVPVFVPGEHPPKPPFWKPPWTKTSDLCSAMCLAEKNTFAMRCVFTAICALAAEIHCDVGHDASITAIAMPRCGQLRSSTSALKSFHGNLHDTHVGAARCSFTFDVYQKRTCIATLPALYRAQNQENGEIPFSESKNTLFHPPLRTHFNGHFRAFNYPFI